MYLLAVHATVTEQIRVKPVSFAVKVEIALQALRTASPVLTVQCPVVMARLRPLDTAVPMQASLPVRALRLPSAPHHLQIPALETALLLPPTMVTPYHPVRQVKYAESLASLRLEVAPQPLLNNVISAVFPTTVSLVTATATTTARIAKNAVQLAYACQTQHASAMKFPPTSLKSIKTLIRLHGPTAQDQTIVGIHTPIPP